MTEPRRFLPRLPLSVIEECWHLAGDSLRGWYVEYGRDVVIYETHREGIMGTEQMEVDRALQKREAATMAVEEPPGHCQEVDQEVWEQAPATAEAQAVAGPR
jgi:hypothetical protein